MNQFKSKDYTQKKSEEIATQLNIIKNGRFATLLFMIGCFFAFIEYNYSEKAIFQTMFNTDLAFDSEVKAAKIAETVSIIMLIAIIIYANNAMTTFKLDLNDSKTSSNTSHNKIYPQGSRLIACFDILKVIGYMGAAIGFYINARELEESKA